MTGALKPPKHIVLARLDWKTFQSCFFQSLLPFFMYDLPFQRVMDLDDLVLSHSQDGRKVQRFKECRYGEQVYQVMPYRHLSAAYTTMLSLCDPYYRDFHRSV